MRALGPSGDADFFFRRLSRAAVKVLLLDYDGTLAPFREVRNEARPYPGVEELLTEIVDSGEVRLVLVTGRPIDGVRSLLQLDPMPEIWGSYGFERRRANGRSESADLTRRAAATLSAEADWISSRGFGDFLERKPFGLALHSRGAASERFDRARRESLRRWEDSGDASVCLEEFDGGLELRAAGRGKAYAVERVLEEAGPGTVAAYLGDDASDEPAFRAVRSAGIAVLVRPNLRVTEADLWISPPGELLGFLRRWLESVPHPHAPAGNIGFSR